MSTQHLGFHNRREFFRLNFNSPVRFRAFPSDPDAAEAVTRNISSSGVLFQSPQALPVSSIVWMNVDLRTLRICQEIEERAIIVQEGILGRVVRVEEDGAKDSVGYDVGVRFLTQDERDAEDVRRALADLQK